MRKLFFSFILFGFFSCKRDVKSRLQLTVTSKSGSIFKELKSFTLISFYPADPKRKKSLNFRNVHSVEPNQFILNVNDTGCYFGLIQVVSGESHCNIDIDSITIHKGNNYLNKEINIGETNLL